MNSIRNEVDKGELKDMELFVFTENWVFETVFYEGNKKSPLLFETLLWIHRITM